MIMPAESSVRLPLSWGAGLALARSILFAGTALTLLLNPSWILFTTSAQSPVAPRCDVYTAWSFFCLFSEHLEFARLAAGIGLVVMAVGFAPALTAIPAAYLLSSASVSLTLGDGGDQLAGILGILLLPTSLTDWRWWSWRPARCSSTNSVAATIAFYGWVAIRAQIFVVYLEASIGKLRVPEWADGTALYYWFRSPTFGPGQLVAPFAEAFTAVPVLTASATIGVMVLEFVIAIGFLLPLRWRKLILVSGVFFHLLIIVFMGITSFSIVMTAALLLHLAPISCSRADLLPRRKEWVDGGRIVSDLP